MVPGFDGEILSLEWKEFIWARYLTGAPRLRTKPESLEAEAASDLHSARAAERWVLKRSLLMK